MEIYDTNPTADSQLANISTRGFVQTGNNVMIGGFILGGSSNNTRIVVRGIGPSLAQFGLSPVLADPTLELHDVTGAIIASNDNWMDTQETEIEETSLAPAIALESAILITIPPGSYTAIVRGNRGDKVNPLSGSGTTLIEIYDISLTIGEGLDNISTRGAVQISADPMITGFIIANGGDQKVVLRALEPSLEEFGLSGLSDPRLDLFDGEGNLLASNDNWQDSQAADIEATGLAPSDPLEAAILITLPRGAYTAVLSPVEGVIHGVALAELYKIQ